MIPSPVSPLEILLHIVRSCGVLLYVHADLISFKDSREPLGRSLELLLYAACCSQALSLARSSCRGLPEHGTLSVTFNKTSRFFLGSTSLHRCPGNSFQPGVLAMSGLASFAPLLLGSQSCAACSPVCEHGCSLYLVPAAVAYSVKVIQESLILCGQK